MIAQTCINMYMCACVYIVACVCACMRACVHACMRDYVSARVRECAYTNPAYLLSHNGDNRCIGHIINGIFRN